VSFGFLNLATSLPLQKTGWRHLETLKIELPCDPTIPFLGIFPKEYKSGDSKDTCTPMFTAPLFTIVKLWKQVRFPTTDEWIKKM
jgi:hypothetical protein